MGGRQTNVRLDLFEILQGSTLVDAPFHRNPA